MTHSKMKDESVVDMISSLVSMTVSDLPDQGKTLTPGAFKKGQQVSLKDELP